MTKASPTTFKVGTLREFADWTRRVVRDPEAARGVPKTWFDSQRTAEAAGSSPPVSAEAMVKLLSPANLAVLDTIRQHKPDSVRELASLTGRKEASLSRTLKRFAQAGIVAFREGPHRTKVPTLIARRVHLDIDLTGQGSAVEVDADAAA